MRRGYRLEDGLRDELIRIRALRFCGIQRGDTKAFLLFEDERKKRGSFSIQPGQTLGQALDTLDAHWTRPVATARRQAG